MAHGMMMMMMMLNCPPLKYDSELLMIRGRTMMSSEVSDHQCILHCNRHMKREATKGSTQESGGEIMMDLSP